MKYLLRTLGACALCTMLLPSLVWSSPVPVKTAWIGEHETFIVWYAKQQGWDKEVGLDLNLMRFDSGKTIVDGLSAYEWAVAGCGAVPALLGSPLASRLSIIAIANDESAANAIYVRKDSLLLDIKGTVPAYPFLRGSQESVRGKTFLCQRGTSAHYLLISWLNLLGLGEKDVKFKFMEPTPALRAFASGLGDAVVLWAPLTYTAEQQELVPLVHGDECGVSQPVLLVANTEYAQKHPDRIESFLKIYLRGVDFLKNAEPDTIVNEYIRFHQEWASRTLSVEEAKRDIQEHPVFDLSEQLAMFDTSVKRSILQKWLGAIVDFYQQQDLVHKEDQFRLQRLNNVTDVYLKGLRDGF